MSGWRFMDTTLVNALREALQQECNATVEQVETHISWVLLTRTHAFKLKKPVHLPFVDFSSIEARKHFCDEELRLNRRFAPALYLDVVPVCGTPASPRIGGDGVPIDHLVRMRRFPASSLLCDLLATGRLDPVQLDGLACAWQLARQTRGRARLMITHGFSGAGKSSIASQLLCAAGAVRVRSDVERKRLYGLDPLARSTEHGLDIYGEQATDRTFDRLRVCAREALLAGYPVIVDAAFLRRAQRLRLRALATELRVPFAILDCRADPDTLRRRVAAREAAGLDASEAGVAVLECQLAHHEPLLADERACVIDVDTQAPVDIPLIEAAWRTTG